MIITPPDLVSALFFLLLLEGFRRVGPEGVVITRWRSHWTTGKSPRSVWLRTIDWLWLLPLQMQPSTFICRSNNTEWLSGRGTAVNEVRRALHDAAERYASLCILTSVQAVILLFVLPPIGIFGSTRAIYAGILLVLCLAAVITGHAWRSCRWNSLKYIFYPPSSVFAVVDATLGILEKVDFDAVVAATLPPGQAVPWLRRYYRSLLYEFGQEPVHRDRVKRRIAAVLADAALDPEAILRAPGRRAEETLGYCPCCDEEYVISDGECSECPGVRLVPFGEAVPS